MELVNERITDVSRAPVRSAAAGAEAAALAVDGETSAAADGVPSLPISHRRPPRRVPSCRRLPTP
jgi:hypothetical protein